ncbi:MAG: type II toxin-antitoxin system RelE/ParE family toxin [Planctomycetota bacterium]|nr:type II toxin-antitoxin system RelE/ParE family toxin [Planctomycetota bacterium]
MAYRIEYRPAFERAFRKLPAEVQSRVAPKISALADNPRPHGCVKMAGPEDLYRLRVGEYRIIYEIHDEVLVVLVIRIGHRREVYR